MERNGIYVRARDGVRLFVQTEGEGESALIVPNSVYMFDAFKRLARNRRVIFFDLRNRGRSEPVEDPALLAGGVNLDIDDIEAIRAHFEVETPALIGHSYLGLVVAAYAMRYPARVSRMIQISPAQPVFGQQYAAGLSYADETLSKVWADLQSLQSQRQSFEPVEFCRKWWQIARTMYVADPSHADRIADWGFCDLPNERNFMKHWLQNISPSLQRLIFQPEDFARVTCPVLTIHGTRDRNAPYGGGLDWSRLLPNAKLLGVEGVGHVPWVEAPEVVWNAIESFLDAQEVFSASEPRLP
jgi:proline iminopeptidase